MRSRPLVTLLLTTLTGVVLAVGSVVLSVSPLPVADPPLVAADEPRLGAHNDTSTPFNLVSLPALAALRPDGRRLRVERLRTGAEGVREYAVSYRSGDLTVTGVLARPDRRGRFPLVVLAHGWHPPAQYDAVRVSARERRKLARHGHVVVQPDYRNYGGSAREGSALVPRPTGYPADVLNAVRAVRRAGLPYLRRGPVDLFGRSMGGGVALQALVARPAMFASAVLSSPLSTRAADNFERWARGDVALRDKVAGAYGLPEDDPRFWRRASVRSYAPRVSVPVRIHHGTADAVCPPRWSRATLRSLRAAGVTASLREYPGQGHSFRGAAWSRMMSRTLATFD